MILETQTCDAVHTEQTSRESVGPPKDILRPKEI